MSDVFEQRQKLQRLGIILALSLLIPFVLLPFVYWLGHSENPDNLASVRNPEMALLVYIIAHCVVVAVGVSIILRRARNLPGDGSEESLDGGPLFG